MSTRSIIVFKNKDHEKYIYVHFDGYPSHRLVQLQEFLKWNGSRNHDVAYSTANFVFWYKMESLRHDNELYKNDNGRTVTTIEDILTPPKKYSNLRVGVGVVDGNWDEYRYKYVVDFDTETIRVANHETIVTVAFGQVVEFDDEDEIIEAQIPAN